jgi:HNH endonuclease
MKGAYRKFSVAVSLAILARAARGGRVYCERCDRWCPKRKDYQIDHVIPEGMRPAEDLKRPLTPADGQLLCLECHDRKTDGDKAHIALAVRVEAYHAGIERPGKKKMRSRPKAPRPPYRPAAGSPRLLREGFIPARGGRP